VNVSIEFLNRLCLLIKSANPRVSLTAGNVFSGILDNWLFCTILTVTSILQVLIVQFGSFAFAVAEGGLPLKYWGLSLLLGFGSLPVQQVINFLYSIAMNYKGYRNRKRLKKNGSLATHTYGEGIADLVGHDQGKAKK
jgi:hypothetical protein